MSTVIVISMAVLALVIIGNSYQSNRAALIDSAERNAQHVAESIDLKIESFTQPIRSSLQLLELDPVTAAYSHQQRLERLPVLVRTLEANPILSAVYAGYTDGDFFLLRNLKLETIRGDLHAPDSAVYLLQSIQRNPSGRVESATWEFYDASLILLESRNFQHADFDPRKRPWFTKALSSPDTVFTSPYVFFTTREIGVSFAVENKSTGTVIGVDASINDLSLLIKSLQPSPLNEMVLVEGAERAIAFPDPDQIILEDQQGGLRLASVSELNMPALAHLLNHHEEESGIAEFAIGEKRWYGLKMHVGAEKSGLRLIFAVPEQELLAEANRRLADQLVWSSAIMFILLVAGWFVGSLISRPLKQLTEDVGAIARFDFQHKLNIKTPIREVRHLTRLISAMASGIDNFKSISRTLAREEDLDKMLNQVTGHLIGITSAGAGYVYLFDGEAKKLCLAGEPNNQVPKNIDCKGIEVKDLDKHISGKLNLKSGTPFSAPLVDRDGELLGALLLIFDRRDPTGMRNFQTFVEEISGSAATAIRTRRQVEEQEALIDSIIRLLADAIDAKSPYTSGHCERVPELATLVIDAAEASNDPCFADFTMSEQQRREFRIAAWLHDCGKITSPEYVVDKATKLETIYNRIHEIRTRFEVLWRDAEIAYWQGCVEGDDPQILKKRRLERQSELEEGFEFVAAANQGGEFMSDEDIARLKAIGQQSWQRHFDNTLGLSSEERALIKDGDTRLPRAEKLLDDKVEHIIPWADRIPPVERSNPENKWGFDMALPKQRFNKGELHNLSVRRGTLTEEERFTVNDHIVQTIKMLSSLPLPKDLRKVPDIAGNHHEKMDGTGYPRKLAGEKLSLPERVMVLADIFEALTAADRPYKDAKKLSEAIKIMGLMVKDKHVDGEVYKLFLESGAYLDYANKYLQKEQLDSVDVQSMLTLSGLCLEEEVEG